jgi:hypothetical protein
MDASKVIRNRVIYSYRFESCPDYKKIKTMWIRTINGIEFIEVKFTSQGFPIPKTK